MKNKCHRKKLITKFNFLQDGFRPTFSSPFSYISFYIVPFSVHDTGFSFWIFSGFLAVFILLPSNNNKNPI